jgi:serine/threonine protein phosphatase PrpC
MLISFACSAQGSSHIKNNKPCEDCSGCFENETYHTSIAIVADGHGGEKYFRSRFGSKLAVETVHKVLDRFIEQTGKTNRGFFNEDAKAAKEKMDENLQRLERDIVSSWREKVLQHIKDNPWDKSELEFCGENKITIDENDNYQLVSIYGTTLLAAVVTEAFWFALQIGDGACVVIRETGKSEIAVPGDEDQGFGITKSLCNKDVLENFRHNFGFEKILGAIVATDGVTDSFSQEKYLEFTISELLKNFVEHPMETKKELENSLSGLSEQGSGDDVSIAVIFNPEAARPLIPVIVPAAQTELAYRQAKKDAERFKYELDALKQEAADWRKKHDAKEKALAVEQSNRKEMEQAIKQNEAELQNKQVKIELLQEQCSRAQEDLRNVREEQKKVAKEADTAWKEKNKALQDADNARHDREKERDKRSKVEQDLKDEQTLRKGAEKENRDLQKQLAKWKKQSVVSKPPKPPALPKPPVPSTQTSSFVISVSTAGSDKALSYIKDGKEKMDRGDNEGALQVYENALNIFGNIQSDYADVFSGYIHLAKGCIGMTNQLFGKAKTSLEEAKKYFVKLNDEEQATIVADLIALCEKWLNSDKTAAGTADDISLNQAVVRRKMD